MRINLMSEFSASVWLIKDDVKEAFSGKVNISWSGNDVTIFHTCSASAGR